MSGVFGGVPVEPNAVGGAVKRVQRDGVPMPGLYGRTPLHGITVQVPDWQPKPSKDPGLCVDCAERGLKGRKKRGAQKCTPHIMADARRAAKARTASE